MTPVARYFIAGLAGAAAILALVLWVIHYGEGRYSDGIARQNEVWTALLKDAENEARKSQAAAIEAQRQADGDALAKRVDADKRDADVVTVTVHDVQTVSQPARDCKADKAIADALNKLAEGP